MKSIKTQYAFFSVIAILSLASFFYLQFGFNKDENSAFKAGLREKSEKIFVDSEKKIDRVPVLKIIISNIINVIIIK
ncbi:MAG: hypothetical protein IPN29_10430 [Saprospiraceae bacterium]|nr:hypothetical protein [Saprospiraceae bacterium]